MIFLDCWMNFHSFLTILIMSLRQNFFTFVIFGLRTTLESNPSGLYPAILSWQLSRKIILCGLRYLLYNTHTHSLWFVCLMCHTLHYGCMLHSFFIPSPCEPLLYARLSVCLQEKSWAINLTAPKNLEEFANILGAFWQPAAAAQSFLIKVWLCAFLGRNCETR